ncbi:MAG: 4Fe-4S dicluster domain-containing protein [Gemmatimonadetes bacterium]|nr:4Fe-4S dicluster domain-containing protein [Gemmatimonadota bacterium]
MKDAIRVDADTVRVPPARLRLAEALESQKDRLLPCVHCGFCLPACPTYNRLGDEADSPRGRLHLMGAVVEGRLDPASDAFQTHIDRCLGCRACEPVCPSGVEYGVLLEAARETAVEARKPGILSRLLLTIMASPALRGPFFFGGRVLRATGLADLAVRLLPSRGLKGSGRMAMAMLAATKSWIPPVASDSAAGPGEDSDHPGHRGTVGILLGCVQQGLYDRVNKATARTLEANGYRVVEVRGQGCCGALHAHAGSLQGARDLARSNMDAFESAGVDFVVSNAAGCGAAMKDYHVLFETDASRAPAAAAFSERVRDVTELLAEAGPLPGAEVKCAVAYDHPCHLLHAQGVARPPIQVLEAVPGVEVRVVEGAEECCGGAGIYGLTHPELGGSIGRDKVAAVTRAGATVACSANPGCMMQIGAGLRLDGASQPIIHPVELLDESYKRAGIYK